jgi:hypothetical protein
LCQTIYREFKIHNVYSLTAYARIMASALAHVNRTRVTVQAPLSPMTPGWTNEDILIEARRVGWRDASANKT